jgi:hypothetical protein
MSVYKFRVEVDEVEDLFRDIEILSTQTFKDFHEALAKYFEVKKKKPASFFISNEKWQKIKEISLGFEGTVDTSVDGTKEAIGKYVGKKAKRMIYINESVPGLTFLIELMEEHDNQIRSAYPVCIKSVGSASMMTAAVDDLFADNMRTEEGEEGSDSEDGDTGGSDADEGGSDMGGGDED